jgi:hypothetical protein
MLAENQVGRYGIDSDRLCAFPSDAVERRTLGGTRILGSKTVAYMTSDHLGTTVVPGPYYLPGPGYGFGLGFAARRDAGGSPFAGSPGEYN